MISATKMARSAVTDYVIEKLIAPGSTWVDLSNKVLYGSYGPIIPGLAVSRTSIAPAMTATHTMASSFRNLVAHSNCSAKNSEKCTETWARFAS